REVATGITEAGQQILEAIDQVPAQVHGVNWVGPDYDAYQQDWNSFDSSQVSSLVDAFQAKSDELTQHAEPQEVPPDVQWATAHPAQAPRSSTTEDRGPSCAWRRRWVRGHRRSSAVIGELQGDVEILALEQRDDRLQVIAALG